MQLETVLKALSLFGAAFVSFSSSAAPANQLGAVDPLIGTGQTVDGVASCEKGATMPYVGVPFGSVMWVPMTRESQFGTLAFNQQDTKLIGFAASRQMAVAMGEWGEFSFLPTMGTGTPSADFAVRGQTISAKSFTPYSGSVSAGGVKTDYTATAHAAIYKITFPGHVTRQPQIVFDASRDDMFRRFPNTATVQPGGLTISDGGQTVVAWNTDNTDWYRSKPMSGYRARFRMEFSEKPVGFATYRHVVTRDGTNTVTEAGATSVEADACGATFTFAQSSQVRTIFVKCSVSLVSDANLKSLMEEILDWDFDGTLNETKAAWNEKFSLLKFSASDSDVTKTLATAIYHALQWPRDVTEFGRHYSPATDEVRDGVMFTGQSMWDTYRAENALLGFLAPDRIGGMMKSLVNIADESGYLPLYPNPGETSCMVGAPGEVQLAEAVQKGWLTGADAEAAYAAAKRNATVPSAKDAEVKWRDQEWWTGSVEGRGGLTTYQSLGYVACDRTCQSVSRTQDFSHADDAMARFAAFLGKEEDAAFFAARSHSWTNLWKRDERNVAPRNAAGAWVKPEDCILDGNPYDGAYSESGAAQARWAVPHDLATLVGLLGGTDAAVRELDAYEASVTRAKDGLVLHDDHSNEPAHHIPYLYNLLGAHDTCAKAVREIMADYYPSSRQWRRGHDDCGQMSAWYVLSALGFYPVNPADLTYRIGSPLVDAATLAVGGGKTLRITVNNQAKANVYVKSVKLNGEELADRTITHAQIMAGGDLVFIMSATPTLAYTLTANKTASSLSFLGDAKTFRISDAKLTYTGTVPGDTTTWGSVNFATDGADRTLALVGANAAFECTAGDRRANFGSPYADAAGRLAIRLTVPAEGWSAAPIRATGGDAKVFFGQNVDFEIDATAVTTTLTVPLARGTDAPGVCFYSGSAVDEQAGGAVENATLARAKVNVAPGMTYAFVREGNALALALTAAGEEEDPPESQPTSKFDAAHTIICFGDSLTFGSMSDRITVDDRANFFDGRLAGTKKEGCYPYWLSGMVGADYNVVSQCRHGMYSDTILAWQGAVEVQNARAFTLKSSAPTGVATNFLFGGTSLGGLGSLPPDDDAIPAAKFGGLLAPTYPLWEEPAVAGSCDSLPASADGPEWGPSGSLAGTLAGYRVRLVGNRGTNMTIRAIDKLPSGGVTIPARTRLVPDATVLDRYRKATQVIMCGANDRPQNYETFLPRIQSAVDDIRENGGGRFLVMSPHVFVTATKNEWGKAYQASDAAEHANRLVSTTPNRVEKAYAARFGDNYLNLRVAMISRGLQIAVAEGWLPASTDQSDPAGWARTDGTGLLSSDAAHFNTAGYKVMAYLVREKLDALGYLGESGIARKQNAEGPTLGYLSGETPLLSIGGSFFKDLNRDGELAPYEDWRQSAETRAADLAARLSPEDLYGLLLFAPEQTVANATVTDAQRALVADRRIRTILVGKVASAREAAEWNNAMQAIAERSAFGIPVSLASDPRHDTTADASYVEGATGAISRWPNPIGLAATFSPELMRRFAQVARRECRALGFTTALSPQVDIATDPRWRRFAQTYGECPDLTAAYAREYADGFQSCDGERGGWGAGSVATMAKHWPGGGTGEGGRDAHYGRGKYAVYPGGGYEQQKVPFLDGAFALEGGTGKCAAVIPYYSISWGQDEDPVGNCFSSEVIQRQLRGTAGFDGVVCTDWQIVKDYKDTNVHQGKPWGMEDKTSAERALRSWLAGCDMIGGWDDPTTIRDAVQLGIAQLGEERMTAMLRASATRVLVNFFRTGLFEDPYVEVETSAETVGCAEFMREGYEAQVKSVVMLKNKGNVLPLKKGAKVWVPPHVIPCHTDFWGWDVKEQTVQPVTDAMLRQVGLTAASSAADADAALVFIDSPMGGWGYREDAETAHQNGTGYVPISLQYDPYTATAARSVSIAGGDPTEVTTNRSYRGKTTAAANASDRDQVVALREQMGDKPVIVVMTMANPAVPGATETAADAFLAVGVVQNQAVLEIVSGASEPSGLLPYQMPANMTTVEKQYEDLPFDMTPWTDTEGNAWDFAFGLDWSGVISDERTARAAEWRRLAAERAPIPEAGRLVRTVSEDTTETNLGFDGTSGKLILDDATLTVSGTFETWVAYRFGEDATGALALEFAGANAGLAHSTAASAGFVGSTTATSEMLVKFTVPATPWTVAPLRALETDSKIRFQRNVSFEVDATAVVNPGKDVTVRVPLASGTAIDDDGVTPVGVLFDGVDFAAVKARSRVTCGDGVTGTLVYEDAVLYVELAGSEAGGEWDDVETTRIDGVTDANREDVETTLNALKAELGTDAKGVGDWLAGVYGEGTKVPAAKVAAARHVGISAAFKLPLMTGDPVITVASAESAADGGVAFRFRIRDDAGFVAPLARADLRRLVKYALRLEDGFGPSPESAVEIRVDASGDSFTATFVGGAASGFVRSDFT